MTTPAKIYDSFTIDCVNKESSRENGSHLQRPSEPSILKLIQQMYIYPNEYKQLNTHAVYDLYDFSRDYKGNSNDRFYIETIRGGLHGNPTEFEGKLYLPLDMPISSSIIEAIQNEQQLNIVLYGENYADMSQFDQLLQVIEKYYEGEASHNNEDLDVECDNEESVAIRRVSHDECGENIYALLQNMENISKINKGEFISNALTFY